MMVQQFFKAIQRVWTQYAWWHMVIFLIGALSAFFMMLNLFTPVGKETKPVFLSQEMNVETQDFMLMLSHLLNAPIETGGGVEIINNGDAFLEKLLADISNAKQTITVSTYIWEDGRMSEELLTALLKKQQEGVPVRILLDAFGGKSADSELFKQIEQAGGKVEMYKPVTIGKIMRFHMRNHRRAIVIDGKIAYTGGMGIADKWLGDARNPDEWRDVMFRTTGVLARRIQSSFGDLWASASGEVLAGPEFFPLEISEKGVQFIHYGSIPSRDSALLSKAVAASILSAQEKVYIVTPYLIPTNSLEHVLMSKAKEGVDVRIIVPNKHTDTQSVRWASHTYYNRLLSSGVKIYEYQPTFMHSKYMVIDDSLSVIGSLNMDPRSLIWNDENAVFIQDETVTKQLHEVYKTDEVKALEITLDEWKKRSYPKRVLEFLSGMFVQQF